MPAPTGFFSICPHCPSSDRSRRSAIYFPTTAVVAAPAGALSLFSHCPQQCLPPQELSLRFPTAPAVPAPAGALPVFPHYRSSDCSPMSATCFFPTAAAVSAPVGALPVFPHCRSSARSRRSLPIISPLPQQCPLPQELHQYLLTAAAVFAPTGAPYIYFPTAAAVSTLTSSLLSPHRHTSTLQQKPLLPLRCRSIFTSIVQHPIRPKPCIFWGVS